MRVFCKKTVLYTQDHLLSPKFREMYECATEPFFHTQQKKKATNTTLEHVMHLFEEKSKYPPQQVIGPLPIKANGAIVVNRPTNHSMNPITAVSAYMQDDEDDRENNVIDEVNHVEQVVNSSSDSNPSSTEDDTKEEEEVEEVIDILELVHEENKRLRQQILFEREQNEKWRTSKEHYEEKLVCSKQIIRNLQRTSDIFEKLFDKSTYHFEQGLESDTVVPGQNPGDDGTLQCSSPPRDSSAAVSLVTSYERKLQILLNEIEAMEQEQLESLNKMAMQKRESDKLARKLKYKDDIIRQLAYDLQVHSHRIKHQ